MIEFKNIDLTYGDRTLFKNYNLNVNRGDIVLFNGPSGCGKSSLIRMIPGFLKPDRGEVLFEGQRIDKRTLKFVRRNVSYVSQDVDLRNEVVGDLLSEIFHYKINRHISSPRVKIGALLEEFRLSADVLEKRVRELSGGERQRIGIIICLVLDRDIWLLDEVTSALDSDLKELVVRKVVESGKTVFVVSHDPQWEIEGVLNGN